MEFQRERVFTALNADELKVGSKVIFADSLEELKESVKKDDDIEILAEILDESHSERFCDDDTYHWALAYLVEEPEEKKLKWTDLKIGDVITNGSITLMVTGIDYVCSDNAHIHIGNRWFTDYDLTHWEKVEK